MILITEFMDDSAVAALRKQHSVDYAPELADDQAAIPGRLAGCRALIVRNRTRVTPALLEAAPDLTCVGRLGVGLDNIDQSACAARGIAVFPATGANTRSVSEYVVTSAMMLLRGAYMMGPEMRAGDWPRGTAAGREVAGLTMGLVGFGAIARDTATLAQALGFSVVAHDPMVAPEDPAWAQVTSLPLDALLHRADVLSLHVPLTDGTRHLIDGAKLDRLPPQAVVINAARGGVLDEDALVARLRSGRLGGAALDVFEAEPMTAETGAGFPDMPNLILTPHIAGVTKQSNKRVSDLIARRVADHLAALPD
ncbi:hydroxyacid dehydrogenase [Oceanomicrobium pacificus]|uniref:3-phosphoglycerate dehydrogenase n=1 Tax=Oceanomicrobium pacificus TaxID=2692916 RepID=A0A6B0TQ23_9RHOB|nr:hydroxyacid dehydrogenase [Oceanomicrobium pacificus]MXU64779.1 3-phosphoglycerate dehydrogenase [Oceanomicrobium pacificus]